MEFSIMKLWGKSHFLSDVEGFHWNSNGSSIYWFHSLPFRDYHMTFFFIPHFLSSAV